MSPHRAVVPPSPADRPRGQRRAVRVLVIDDHNRLLLFRDSDLGLSPVPHWWMTPGGGVDPGESGAEAAIRELHEETGLIVEPSALHGPIATRRVIHGYSDVIMTQDESFWVVRCAPFEVDVSGHTEQEQATMTSHAWLTRDEIADLDEPVWPLALMDLWDRAAEPGVWPVDLGTIEESTVPA